MKLYQNKASSEPVSIICCACK